MKPIAKTRRRIGAPEVVQGMGADTDVGGAREEAGGRRVFPVAKVAAVGARGSAPMAAAASSLQKGLLERLAQAERELAELRRAALARVRVEEVTVRVVDRTVEWRRKMGLRAGETSRVLITKRSCLVLDEWIAETSTEEGEA